MTDNGAAVKSQVQGVIPVIQTPFNQNDQVDYEVLAGEVEWAIEQGVDGFTVAMVSEYLRLTDDERIAVSQVTVEAAGGRPVVASVGAESTYQACQLARRAEEIGASALMAIPPIQAAVGEDEMARYFEALLRAVSVPIIVQDASGYVGVPMSIEFQVSLIERFGDRVMLKPETPPMGARLSKLRDLSGGAAKVFEGSGGIALVDTFRRGIVGTMPSVDCCWALVALWRALSDGDEARTYTISSALTPLIAMQTSLDAYVAIEKHLLVRQGVFRSDRMRGPVDYELDRETRAELDRLYDRLRLAVG